MVSAVIASVVSEPSVMAAVVIRKAGDLNDNDHISTIDKPLSILFERI
jgi:hypothetical protein